MTGKFKVVALCGSTRFKEQFLKTQQELTLQGNIVLAPGFFGHAGDLDAEKIAHIKPMLDAMHRQRIDMADEILVINVGGYIGKSTRSEIAYAESAGKPVNYLENKK